MKTSSIETRFDRVNHTSLFACDCIDSPWLDDKDTYSLIDRFDDSALVALIAAA